MFENLSDLIAKAKTINDLLVIEQKIICARDKIAFNDYNMLLSQLIAQVNYLKQKLV